jgi:hypothetical protein
MLLACSRWVVFGVDSCLARHQARSALACCGPRRSASRLLALLAPRSGPASIARRPRWSRWGASPCCPARGASIAARPAGDREHVERAASERPTIRCPARLATVKRDGELARAEALIGELPGEARAELRSAALNLRGIARLAEGNVNEAIPPSNARARPPRAPRDVQPSQATARAAARRAGARVAEARRLDPDLVDRYMAADGANVTRADPRAARAARVSARGAGDERRVRVGARAARAPARRRRERKAVARAARGGAVRAARAAQGGEALQPLRAPAVPALLARGHGRGHVPALRAPVHPARAHRSAPAQAQLDLDRRRQRLRAGALFLLCPADVVEGAGSRASTIRAGVADCGAPAAPLPWELGELARLAALALAALLLAPLYAAGLLSAFRRIASLRKVAE